MAGRWAMLALLLAAAAGCDSLRDQVARGRRPKSADATAAAKGLGKLDPQFAHGQPVSTPVPPAPPPLPSDPPVQPPSSDQYVGTVPTMPFGKPAVAPPEPPIVQTGAIALPEPDGDDRKPIRDRLDQRKQKRDDAKTTPVTPDKPKPDTEPPVKGGGDDGQAVKKLLDAANKRYADLTDYEARLVKREVVNGKQLPQDEIVYRLRTSPLSVYMKVLSAEGQGREVMYVKGQFDNKIHLITGKGDHLLAGAGYKTDMDPDSKAATAKSRYRIYEAGFGRTLTGLAKALNPPDGSSPPAVKTLGLVQRKEVPYALEGVEVTIRAGEDPMLAKGGRRQVFFDPKPDSPGYVLPILVVTTDADGKEVEYYFFDQLKVPSGMKDADWNPATLGKRK